MTRTTKKREISPQDWAQLRYPITLQALAEEEGGGWLATIPMLGEGALMADGGTADEAVQRLESLRIDLYDQILGSGQPIPRPVDATDNPILPSGKWVIRTDPHLHAELQQAARDRGLSLNAYSNQCLNRGHMVTILQDEIRITIREGRQAPPQSEARGKPRRTAKQTSGTDFAIHDPSVSYGQD